MDDGKFMEWYQNNFDDNAVLYAEKNEEAFEEYCIKKYVSEYNSDYEV